MPDSSAPEPEILRALELADGYLSDAEHVLWKTAAASENRELNAAIEHLTQDMWTIQHLLQDIQDTGEQ